jgi:DNA-binding Lrp family transcriptional regulator
MTPSARDIALIDRWQRDFPLIERPFAEGGSELGLDETATIAAFRRLRDAGVISRIGAVVRPNTVGASTLAAMRVPPGRLETVARTVSAEPLVNHNYQREHALNLWFVVAGPSRAAIGATIERIERHTGLPVLDLPLVKAYHIDLGFSLSESAERRCSRRSATAAAYVPGPSDSALLAAMQDGLPLVPRPYAAVGQAVGISGDDVIDRIAHLAAAGVVSRFGCVVRHRALGYAANAMVVWDVPDALVDAAAGTFVGNPRVTLCYRRPRRMPDWPFNLFCMVHAKTRPDANAVIDELNRTAHTAANAQAVLFSARCFKQRGALFSEGGQGIH